MMICKWTFIQCIQRIYKFDTQMLSCWHGLCEVWPLHHLCYIGPNMSMSFSCTYSMMVMALLHTDQTSSTPTKSIGLLCLLISIRFPRLHLVWCNQLGWWLPVTVLMFLNLSHTIETRLFVSILFWTHDKLYLYIVQVGMVLCILNPTLLPYTYLLMPRHLILFHVLLALFLAWDNRHSMQAW